MAEALVSVVLDQLATVIKDEIQQEVRMVVGVEKEIDKLTITYRAIQALLKDAEHKQIKDELVKVWLEEFKDVTYDMGDILDEWNTEMLIRKSQSSIDYKGKNKVCTFFCSLSSSCFSQVGLHHDIGSRIKEIRERLDFIASEKNKYNLIEFKNNDIDKHPERVRSSSMIDVSDVYGRTIDKDIIKSRLLCEGSNSNTQQGTIRSHLVVVSIVGMGGLGKTTLAQLVFNDEQVKHHFEMTMWVCVSDPFDQTNIVTAIIQEAGVELPESTQWNALHNCLSETVKNKRILLVLDDVWTHDERKWEPLELALKSSSQESRILVTTRKEKVARMMKTSYDYYLENLSDDDCWSLLRRMAFVGRKEEEKEILNEIGTKIAKLCKGLPLAAKTIGSLLYYKTTEKDWQNVLESEIWELENVEKGFLRPALLLSYYDLPSPLKSCFEYCSIFPKDYEMKKNRLIKLWMAQGFLKCTRRNEELEMIGEEYFNNLVMRSFFQNLSKDDNGNIISCKMHDLLHDFAQFLTNNACYNTQNNQPHLLKYSRKIRHLTFISDDEVVDPKSFLTLTYKAENLRTFQVLRTRQWRLPSRDARIDLFRKLQCPRVLCFVNCGLTSLPNDLGKLMHLRYLDLSDNHDLEKLPVSITSLYNLQTLKLSSCYGLYELPQEMWKMINLRHLNIKRTVSLRYLPRGLGKLTSLQTLPEFKVSGATEGGKIDELKDLNHLKANLTITGLKTVKTINEALEAELKKKNLHFLRLNFCCTEKDHLDTLMVENMNGVLESLQPNPNLMNLHIENYLGSKFPTWIGIHSMLFHLAVLTLCFCNNCTVLPALGQLPSLATLKIYRLKKLKHIGLEFYRNVGRCANNNIAFPKLKDLEITSMDSLEVWDLGDGEEVGEIMPCLSHVKLSYCENLKAYPSFWKLPSLEMLLIEKVGDIRNLGVEFHGRKCFDRIAFPKLEQLRIRDRNLMVWDLGDGVGAESMPLLRDIHLECRELEALPDLWRLPSLEVLNIKKNQRLRQIVSGFYGSETDGERVDSIAFPVLKRLFLDRVDELEEWGVEKVLEESNTDGKIAIMPLLTEVDISECDKLKTLRALARLPSIEILRLDRLSAVKHMIELTAVTTCGVNKKEVKLFPNLKELKLDTMHGLVNWQSDSVEQGGDMMPSHFPNLEKLVLDNCVYLSHLPSLPKLKFLTIFFTHYPTLPPGLAQFKALQKLNITMCNPLTCIHDEVKHLTNLQELRISMCENLVPRCRKDGEDWSIISHILNIYIDKEKIQ